MNIHDIEVLVDLVASSAVGEITLKNGGRRLTIRKAAAPRQKGKSAAPSSGSTPGTALATTGGAANATPTTKTITAPMVGIFHHAEPPVAPGARVEAGRVVGIIESMKLMNDVRSNVTGVVKEISVEAGMAVEYGQVLFTVTPE
jgi:acetyl-CoA carboxylase biotin carboxyl carrier protein